ncbi:hypothetical protein LB507_007112 [Fusarium sp. FIESC RH6]|nr:hypothetical protein LB507_007112 [Fusarium sp. FIESC RH6]
MTYLHLENSPETRHTVISGRQPLPPAPAMEMHHDIEFYKSLSLIRGPGKLHISDRQFIPPPPATCHLLGTCEAGNTSALYGRVEDVPDIADIVNIMALTKTAQLT